jgi:multidrug efflux system membrane fusion protein
MKSAALPERPKPPVPPPATASRRGYGWVWWLVILGLGYAGWHFWPEIAPHVMPHVTPFLPQAETPKTKTGPRVTPVVTAAVQQRDMNLYLNGLGTVTALKTVTIRSRVDGELINVAFNEGQTVHEGDLLAEIDPRPFEVQRDQARAQMTRNEVLLGAAQRTLTRYTQLLESKIATQQQIDDQKSLVDQAEAAIKSDKALIATTELQLTYCRIVAPITGRIGLRLVDEGNIVRPNDANGLAVITQLQPIALVFTIPQDDIARVQRSMRPGEYLTVDAFDRDFKNQLATGRLVALDNQVDPTNGTVRLKAEFDNDDGLLFPNQFVNVRLLVEVLRGANVIPSAAVQRGPNGTFVYAVQPDDTVRVQNITIGPTEGTITSVAEGLAPGDIVVTEGLDKLTDKAKVSTRDSKAGGDGAKKKTAAGDANAKGNTR